MDFLVQVQGQGLSVCRQRADGQGRRQDACLSLARDSGHFARHRCLCGIVLFDEIGFCCCVSLSMTIIKGIINHDSIKFSFLILILPQPLIILWRFLGKDSTFRY